MKTLKSIAAAAMIAAAGLALAGPLNPAAGPVTSTYKTLVDVEPRTIINAANTPGDAQYEYIITQPGSYYLDRNINMATGKSAIKVSADNVTIDMNGFSMVCLPDTTGTAITTAGVLHNNIRVFNGGIKGRFQGGLSLFGSGNRAERLTLQSILGDAILIGDQGIIRDCVVTTCTGNGIRCGADCIVSGCTCDSAAQGGVHADSGALIEHCTVNTCGAASSAAIFTMYSSQVRDCIANGATFGIQTQYACRIENCSASGNSAQAISAGDESQIRGCTTHGGTTGFYVFSGCTLTECEADTASLDGFSCNGAVLIQGCRAQNCGRDGIYAASNSTILNCQANNNVAAGIDVGGKGRVEGNDAISNGTGFRASNAGGAIFIRNSATSSTSANFSIAAGNVAGPIVTSANMTTNTNPGANFSY